MVIKRKSTRARKSAARRRFARDVAETQAFFDYAYTILDAAVVSATIAGIPPASFEPVLSYWFLNCAAAARGMSKAECDKIVADPAIFGPVVEAIVNFVDQYEFEAAETGDALELGALREIYAGPGPVEQTELEVRRNEKKAVQVLEWSMDVMSRNEELPAMLVELAFIVMWFKVAALNGSISYERYIFVKETVPLLFEAYDPVLTRLLKKMR